jgi:hypothetical protein
MANLSDFKAGDVLLTYGSDMGCHKCVCKEKVLSVGEEGIITKTSDGCRILYKWKNMQHYNGYFLYSEEQEKAMQKQCDNEYNEWLEACRKQLERAHKYHIERNERLKNRIKEKGYFDGTHTIYELSGKNNFYRWKKYDILHIDDELNIFGVADDGDTMFLTLDDLCVPTQQEIEREVA